MLGPLNHAKYFLFDKSILLIVVATSHQALKTRLYYIIGCYFQQFHPHKVVFLVMASQELAVM